MALYFPLEIEGFDTLCQLALDIRWSWNHMADSFWSELDPHLWELTRNPWIVLRTVSAEVLKKHLSDPQFRRQLDELAQKQQDSAKKPSWFQTAYPESPFNLAAYFSMEFMLSEALPIYSGGLGNVAGDQLKSASDLGVPVIAVGLLYQQGYFRQVIDKDGNQQALYPYNDPGQLTDHSSSHRKRRMAAFRNHDFWLVCLGPCLGGSSRKSPPASARQQ